MVKGRAPLPVRWHAAVGAVVAVAVTFVGCAGTTSSSAASRTASELSPVSVTFVSAETGWVLGTVPDGSHAKLAVDRTTDGGVTWSKSAAPDIHFARGVSGEGDTIRFADPEDGWITATLTGTTGPLPSAMWSTHDGGASWRRVAVPGGGHVTALDASGGVFQLAELAEEDNGDTAAFLYSATATSDSWVRSATSLPIGAGPVASVQLTLQDGAGWAVENDRLVVAGARFAAGKWTPWTPPCRNANGIASFAASSAADLVAVCEEGVWGPPPAGITKGLWLFASTDGGAKFATVGAIPRPESGDAVAVPPGEPQVVVIGGSSLTASFDGGQTWKTVYAAPHAREVRVIRVVSFVTEREGVAIVTGGTRPSTLLMTRDGGATWSRVALPADTTS